MVENSNAIIMNDLNNDDSKNLVGTSGVNGGQVRVQIIPAQPKTLSHLPHRPAVDLAFNNLTYRVKEGRGRSKYRFFLYYLI